MWSSEILRCTAYNITYPKIEKIYNFWNIEGYVKLHAKQCSNNKERLLKMGASESTFIPN
jgi:hypothetical protein